MGSGIIGCSIKSEISVAKSGMVQGWHMLLRGYLMCNPNVCHTPVHRSTWKVLMMWAAGKLEYTIRYYHLSSSINSLTSHIVLPNLVGLN